MNRLNYLAILFLLSLNLFAQSLGYGQYQSLYHMNDFYERKIVNNELYNAIDFLPESGNPIPWVELYHESDVYTLDSDTWLGNLQAGLKVNVPLVDMSDDELRRKMERNLSSFKPSQLLFFTLTNFTYISEPTDLAPVLEIPFPYIMSTEESGVEVLPGMAMTFGDPAEPLLLLSAGRSFFIQDSSGGSEHFSSIEPTNVFDIRSPRFGAIAQLTTKEFLPMEGQFDLFRYGLLGDLGWIFRIFGSKKQPWESIRYIRELEYNNLNLIHNDIGVENLFQFLDAGYSFKEDKLENIYIPQQWNLGVDFTIDGGDMYSSVYRTQLQLRSGLTWYNINQYRNQNGSLYFLPDDYSSFESYDFFISTPGLGYYAEIVLQNPLLQTLDWFYIALLFNLGVLQAVTGDSDGFDDTMEHIGNQIDNMSRHESDGAYKSNVFNRLVIGYEINSPGTLEVYPFVENQGHFYVYINIFF